MTAERRPAVTAMDWDPPEAGRTYYRHAGTKDLGWMVRRGGRQMIRLDRGPHVEVLRPFTESEWVPDKEHRPLNRIQVAKVCFAADKELCMALGLHKEGKREWIDLSQEDRKHWMHDGPATPKVREVVFERIRDALEHLTT